MSIDKTMYIAGPMTGIPQFNFPAFIRLALMLRGAGFTVVNPAELDDPDARAAALSSEDGDPALYARLTGLTWGDFLARDLKLIADGGIDAICVLPGWARSRGARTETFTAYVLDLPIVRLGGPQEEDGTLHLYNVPLLELVKGWAAKDDISFHTPVTA